MTSGRARIILVVDDDADDRMFVRRALREIDPGFVVAEAVDGVDAIAYLRDLSNTRPDLVLLDLKMPRKDGLETLADIRADPLLRRPPVIVMFTTATNPEYVERAYLTGANAYVGKPSTLAGLREIMAGLTRYWFELATLPGGP